MCRINNNNKGRNRCGIFWVIIFFFLALFLQDLPGLTTFCSTSTDWTIVSLYFLPAFLPAATLTGSWKAHLSLRFLMVIKSCHCHSTAQRKPTSLHLWAPPADGGHGQEKFIKPGVRKSTGGDRDGTIPSGFGRAGLCEDTFLKDLGKLRYKTATDSRIEFHAPS